MTSPTAVASRLVDPIAREVRGALRSPSRRSRTAVAIGRLLGLGFVVCFATGLFSHLLQHPIPGMVFTPTPQWLYRATQGTHVATGIACIPLLLAKLWTIYPLLWQWPAIRSVAHLAERASITLFVASSTVELAIGLLDTYHWYPFPFYFLQVHYALAWVIIGSLAVHIAVKLPIISAHWTRRRSEQTSDRLARAGLVHADAASAPAAHDDTDGGADAR